VKVEAAPATVLRVETDQGNFEVKPLELPPGRPTKLLGGRVTVEPLGAEDLVARTQTEDDFTALTVGPDGHRWVAWIGYDDTHQVDHLLVRDVDDPAGKPEPIVAAGEFASVHLVATSAGGLRAVWCSPGEHKDWDVYTATRARGVWSAPERLTTAAGTDFHLVAEQGSDGGLWLAWQSFRNGNSDIYAKHLDGDRWSADIPVATGPANEWEPSLSVDAAGRAWIGYDTYEHGNYDVYLTSVASHAGQPRVSERVAVARSADFEAHASVLADRGGRVWVAYDMAGPNWGKDFTAEPAGTGRYNEPLHATRRLGLRCVVDGQVHQPRVELPQVVTSRRVRSLSRRIYGDPVRFYEIPQLARDGEGRVWLFFRLNRQGYVDRPKKGAVWDVYATTYTEKGWLQPIQLPRSEGRQNQRIAWATGPDGRLHAAWSDGNHFVERKCAAHYGTLPRIREKLGQLPLAPAVVEPPGRPEEVPEVPWTLKRDGQEYVLCFGDLHRHTDISYCAATIDGSLTDQHRYALDAARLDFLAVTDHTRDVTPYPWWRTQKVADLFHVPGRFLSIYGYERSNETATGGHRNVFLLERGGEVNRSDHYYRDRPIPRPDTRPNTTLYPWLKKTSGALTAAHTPAFDAKAKRGTWDFNDSEVEPVVEVFQGFRHAYERPDRRVSREASVWHALEKGYKLGFIASSDHISTHLSYACVWAKDKSRRALLDALRARRTYAATDRIALDVRLGNALMGEETRLVGERPTLAIRAVGMVPIDEMEVIRSGEVIATLRPGQRQVETSYTDPQPLAGKSYYYVRLRQRDANLAWGSPIWVTR
ncbi:MAG: CehA/McbA family metallohydrolase, partial [Gemmataceae bacterium]|nr:CehA/McbA family metallohydrolase [Gemmataceae bacterium]